jgi:hypothetical protein
MAAMKGSIRYPTRIVTPVPHMRELARIGNGKLSDKAKFRLKVVDWYFRESPRFSARGKPDAVPACRHFGIHRLYCYRLEGPVRHKRAFFAGKPEYGTRRVAGA